MCHNHICLRKTEVSIPQILDGALNHFNLRSWSIQKKGRFIIEAQCFLLSMPSLQNKQRAGSLIKLMTSSALNDYSLLLSPVMLGLQMHMSDPTFKAFTYWSLQCALEGLEGRKWGKAGDDGFMSNFLKLLDICLRENKILNTFMEYQTEQSVPL